MVGTTLAGFWHNCAMQSSLEIIVLAAGQGKRMGSDLPKVLQPLAGRPLLSHVLTTARALSPDKIHVVIGHGAEHVRSQFVEDQDLQWVTQSEQLGTGHAVSCAMPAVDTASRVLVLYGDTPMVARQDLETLLASPGDQLALLSARLPEPARYGRIVRDARGAVTGIIEYADADPAQRAIDEVNTGILAAPAAMLTRGLSCLSSDNAANEYYLTDMVSWAVSEGFDVAGILCAGTEAVLGANDRRELAALERAYQRSQADALMQKGVHLMDPARLDIRGTIDTGKDVYIDANVMLQGQVRLGDGCHIGFGAVVIDSTLGPGTEVLPYSVVEGVVTDGECAVGPFARLRPGTRLGRQTRIGNFVETKKAVLGDGSKASHLSYLGDSTIGQRVNIGAGTITCNYDGVNKHQTVIEDDVFVGSDSQLVAPVTVGEGATIGAGSTITRNAPAHQLTISRGRQRSIDTWSKPKKK